MFIWSFSYFDSNEDDYDNDSSRYDYRESGDGSCQEQTLDLFFNNFYNKTNHRVFIRVVTLSLCWDENYVKDLAGRGRARIRVLFVLKH